MRQNVNAAKKAEEKATEVANTALARRLSTQAILAVTNPNPVEGFFDFAALLAVQSTKIKEDFESTSSMFHTLQNIPYLNTTLHGHSKGVCGVAFSPDSTKVVSSSRDNTLRLWGVETGKTIGEPWQGHSVFVEGVAFSPDSTKVVSASREDPNNRWDHTILIWDVDEESWKERLCRIAGRNFTREEWQHYLGNRPYEKTCPQYPAGC